MKNGKVLYTAQVQSTPDLLDHPNGLKPYRVPEGLHKNMGLAGVNSPTYGEVARVFPKYVYIHEKSGKSGRPNSLGCFVTYDNSDLSGIYSSINQIVNKSKQFDLWVK